VQQATYKFKMYKYNSNQIKSNQNSHNYYEMKKDKISSYAIKVQTNIIFTTSW